MKVIAYFFDHARFGGGGNYAFLLAKMHLALLSCELIPRFCANSEVGKYIQSP